MISKKDLKTIFEAASAYKKCYAGYEYAYVYYSSKTKKTEVLQVVYNRSNFKHLTGVLLLQDIKANEFFECCLNKRLSPSSVNMRPDGTTTLKLQCLIRICAGWEYIKLTGEYNHSRQVLETNNFIGNSNSCVGVKWCKQSEDIYSYVPNTLMRENIHKLVYQPPFKVVAVYRRKAGMVKYNECVFCASDVTMTVEALNESGIIVDASLLH